MFDFGWSEIALIGVVALVLIGPKDLPVAIRAVTDVIKKMRRMAGDLQGHVDEMLREADLKEAHDTFRDLRGGGLRDKMFRAIDRDGSMRRTMSENPLPKDDILGLKTRGGGTLATGLGRPGQAAPDPVMTGATPAAAAVDRQAPSFVPPGSAEPSPPAAAGRIFAPPPAFIPPAAREPGSEGRPDPGSGSDPGPGPDAG